jgi:hypothetical protein
MRAPAIGGLLEEVDRVGGGIFGNVPIILEPAFEVDVN